MIKIGDTEIERININTTNKYIDRVVYGDDLLYWGGNSAKTTKNNFHLVIPFDDQSSKTFRFVSGSQGGDRVLTPASMAHIICQDLPTHYDGYTQTFTIEMNTNTGVSALPTTWNTTVLLSKNSGLTTSLSMTYQYISDSGRILTATYSDSNIAGLEVWQYITTKGENELYPFLKIKYQKNEQSGSVTTVQKTLIPDAPSSISRYRRATAYEIVGNYPYLIIRNARQTTTASVPSYDDVPNITIEIGSVRPYGAFAHLIDGDDALYQCDLDKSSSVEYPQF